LSGCTFCSFYTTATAETYTLSLHDALPISSVYSIYINEGLQLLLLLQQQQQQRRQAAQSTLPATTTYASSNISIISSSSSSNSRSEEHTSELQSRFDLVCRLLLEKQNETTK